MKLLLHLTILLVCSLLFSANLSCAASPDKPPLNNNSQTDTSGGTGNNDDFAGKLSVGDIAPDFTLNDIRGNEVTLSRFKGKKVVINTWWMRCEGCTEEMPLLQQFYEKYSGADMVLLAINNYDREAAVKPYIADKGFTYTIVVDPAKKLGKVYTNCGVPTTFFIDGNGVVKAKKDAGFENLEEIEKMFNSY
jgi:peroxiredoxin